MLTLFLNIDFAMNEDLLSVPGNTSGFKRLQMV